MDTASRPNQQAERRRLNLDVATSLLAPAWVGAAIGVIEYLETRPLLSEGVGGGLLLMSCLSFGMVAALLAAPPLRILREGIDLIRGLGRRRWPALLIAACAGAVVLVELMLRLQHHRFHNVQLAAWLYAGVLLVLLLVWLGLYRACDRLLGALAESDHRWLRLAPWPIGGVLFALTAIRFAGVLLPAAGALPQALLGRLALYGFVMLAAVLFGERVLTGRIRRGALIAAVALPLLLTPLSLHGLAAAPSTSAALLSRGTVTRWLPELARSSRLSDRDGDGYAALLGGGDCDDSSAAVHPGALEVLGNGIDDDCDGLEPQDDPTAGTLTGRIPSCDGSLRLPARTNVLLLVIDAARADRLDESYPRAVLPALRRLAERGAVFERCYTPHPSTAYAFPALFTGLQTRWTRDLMASQWANIPESRTMFQQALGKLGYRSAAIYGHWLAGQRHRMTRGMHHQRQRKERINSRLVVTDALRFIDQIREQGAPFFVYAQLYDPHWNYEHYPRSEDIPWESASRIDRYDAELRNADNAVGWLLAELQDRGVLEQTLVIAVSDHGEEFGEHGGEFHGQTMYEEVIRVPCVIAGPGVEPRRIRQPVSLIDLLPTVVDLLDARPMPAVHGRSLAPLLAGSPCERGPVVGEMQPWKRSGPRKPWLWYLIEGDHKVIYNVEDHSYLLFDLARDPGETRNLMEVEPEIFKRLRELLHQQVIARIALPVGSQARERLAFGPLPPGTPR